MMNIILTATLLTLSKAQECQNYVQTDDWWYLYPVGQCYHEMNVEQIDSNSKYPYWESKIFLCESDGNGGKEAVEYEVGANCDMTTRKISTNTSYPCNGPDAGDTCSCQLNGDASECSFYERQGLWTDNITITTCPWSVNIDINNSIPQRKIRYIVNMCIEDFTTGGISDFYECVGAGYVWYGSSDTVCKSRHQMEYPDNFGCFNGNRSCDSAAPTPRPTPTPAPTNDANSIYHIGGFIYVFLFATYFTV